MRLLAALCVLGATAMTLQACSSSSSNSGQPVIGNTIVPNSTTPAPASCNQLDEQIPAPSIVIAGVTTEATFGVGAYQCSTLTGSGYIVNNYNPVLLDGAKPIEVMINSTASAVLTWTLSTFTMSADNVWNSGQPVAGCDRLTITLTSPSGSSYATYGADIRVGGDSVPCPQRTLDPTDIGAVQTVPPGASISIPVQSVVPDTANATAQSYTINIGTAEPPNTDTNGANSSGNTADTSAVIGNGS